jgi:serine/threonine-protein kinase
MPKVGEVIKDRYELLAHLGDGGTASVWRAADRTLEREVAIKFLYVVDERAVEDLRKQFLREARIASAVKHRNVIQTMDFGETEEGRAYMVMELLHGQELTHSIDADPPLTLEQKLSIVIDILRGLHAIHEVGIVHRDLKPENVYLERDQDGVLPKILDFGIAKNVDRRSSGGGGARRSVLTTKEGIVVGTPEYMPPEQARGIRDLDARADIWSCGVILFELLTGKLPFEGPSEAEVIIKIVTTDAPAVTSLDPSIPKPISDIVQKALMRERDQRYESAIEMQRALLELVRGGTVSSLPAARADGAGLRKAALSIAAAIAIAALLIVAAAQQRSQSESAAQAKAADKPSHVTLELNGVPSDATVYIDNKPVSGTRFSLPNDGFSRLIEVVANGRQPWRMQLPAGNNAKYEVRMPLLPAANGAGAGGGGAPAAVEASAKPAVAAPTRTERRAPSRKDRDGSARKGAKKPPAVWRNLDF